MLEKFGANMKKLRKAQNDSQEELAAKPSMHRTCFSMVESVERNPTIMTLYKIDKVLKVSSEELLPF